MMSAPFITVVTLVSMALPPAMFQAARNVSHRITWASHAGRSRLSGNGGTIGANPRRRPDERCTGHCRSPVAGWQGHRRTGGAAQSAPALADVPHRHEAVRGPGGHGERAGPAAATSRKDVLDLPVGHAGAHGWL